MRSEQHPFQLGMLPIWKLVRRRLRTMRLRAFLPAYLVLAAAVAYILGALWTGLDRLDAIQRFSEASERSERALAQLDLSRPQHWTSRLAAGVSC
jgi:hypothetical protein